MNTISVISIGSLALYILIALSFMKKEQGRQLFRMIYSAVALGIIALISFLSFDGMIGEVTEYLPKSENVLSHAFSFLMLLIPLFFIIIVLNLLLKTKRPRFFMIVCTAIAVLSTAGTTLYCAFFEKTPSSAWMAVLIFCALYIPFLLNFAISGLINADTKGDILIHRISLITDIICAFSLLFLFCFTVITTFGAMGILQFIPVILIWLILPIVPLWVFNRQKAKDDERAGIVKPKFIDFSRLKKKARKDEDI